MSTMTSPAARPLPANLHPAYEWTDAAGELSELAGLTGEALTAYCRKSEENARAHEQADVTASDLDDLAEWLRTYVAAKIERGQVEVSDTGTPCVLLSAGLWLDVPPDMRRE